MNDPDRPGSIFFEATSILAAMALRTTTIRVGTLVNSLIFRNPAAIGRDPSSVWHSLVVFPPLTPWESEGYFRDMVGRYNEIGIDEFCLYFPQTWRSHPTKRTCSRPSAAT